MQTHQISINDSQLTKTFRSWDRGEHHREWAALSHLSQHAPGLAPEPVASHLDDHPPSVVMSVLPGGPPEGRWTPDQLDALEGAHRRLWSVPAGHFEPVPTLPAQATTFWRAPFEDQQRPSDGPAAAAFDEVTAWLFSDEIAAIHDPTVRPVLGQGDPNRANYLWDGSTIRIVDFEDAGRSDQTFELANLVEHLANRGAGFEPLLDRFEVNPDRLLLCRQLISSFWLRLLLPGNSASHRNPPKALNLQAERCLSLLSRSR